MQVRPSLSARVSKAVFRSASKLEHIDHKPGFALDVGLSLTVHQELGAETFAAPARRELDSPEFHLVLTGPCWRTDGCADADRSTRARLSGRSHAFYSRQLTARPRSSVRGPHTAAPPGRVPTIRFQRLFTDCCAHANVDGRTGHCPLDQLDSSSVRKRQCRRALGGLSASGYSSRR